MRRREAGRGAAPAGRFAIGTRAAPGLRPCPLRGPARSWLTTVRSIPNAGPQRHFDLRPLQGKRGTDGESAARRRQIAACGAPRGARRVRQRTRTPTGLRFSARHSLRAQARWEKQQTPDVPRRGNDQVVPDARSGTPPFRPSHRRGGVASPAFEPGSPGGVRRLPRPRRHEKRRRTSPQGGGIKERVAATMERALFSFVMPGLVPGIQWAVEVGEGHHWIAGTSPAMTKVSGPAKAADDKAGREPYTGPQRQRRPQDFALLDIKWIRDNQDAFVKGLEAPRLRAGAA